MIFVELTSSIRFAVVTSSLNGERVELSLANYMGKKYVKKDAINVTNKRFLCMYKHRYV